MQTIGLVGLRLRRKHRTTTADPAAAKAADLIGRDFTAAAVNTRYVGDITYLPLTGEKFLHLGTVIDLASRRLTGWAISDHMRAELVTDALAAAERCGGSFTGAVPHTDHGAQYTSRAFADACRQAGVIQSMSAVGRSADNALAESFNATCKRETPPGPQGPGRRARSPPRPVPLAPPLQHPTPRFQPRTTQPHHLRNSMRHNSNQPGPSRITRVQDSRSRPV